MTDVIRVKYVQVSDRNDLGGISDGSVSETELLQCTASVDTSK